MISSVIPDALRDREPVHYTICSAVHAGSTRSKSDNIARRGLSVLSSSRS